MSDSKYTQAINDMTENEYNVYSLWGELDPLYSEEDGDDYEPEDAGAPVMVQYVPAPRSDRLRRR